MKLLKILAVVLSVCILGAAFIACDSGNAPEDTTAAETTATTKVAVNLIIKTGSETKYEAKNVECNGTLGNAIEVFAAGEDFEGECFNESGILVAIGDLKAEGDKRFSAWYEDKGQSEKFDSIMNQTLEAGKTVIIVLE